MAKAEATVEELVSMIERGERNRPPGAPGDGVELAHAAILRSERVVVVP